MRLLIDLTGKTFGNLTVREMIRRNEQKDTQKIFWRCVCACGGEITVRGASLRNGETRSCGCIRSVVARKSRGANLTGRKFGRLTVTGLCRVPRSSARSRDKTELRIVCTCSCGTTDVFVDRAKLAKGYVKSCGCLSRERVYLSLDVAALRHVLAGYKRGAIDRSIVWDLSDNDAAALIQAKICYYCHQEPEERLLPRHNRRTYRLLGIDRLDSSIGYSVSNCVPCCGRCNYMKRDMTYLEFADRICTIRDNWAAGIIETCCKVAEKHPVIQDNAIINGEKQIYQGENFSG